MRRILLDIKPEVMPTFSLLQYGDTRTGKTHFAATWPRPYIFADVAESGWQTIATMDRSTWFEENVEPIVVGIENMNDIAVAQAELDALISAGMVCTIVFDAFSFYTDFFLAKLFKLQGDKPDKEPDNRKAYGDLGKHLREVRMILGNKRANKIYNCLAKHPEQEDPKGRPMIPGQQSDKFSAGVDFLWHTKVRPIVDKGKVVDEIFERHTRQNGPYIAGHRLGARADLLPNPFEGTYTDLIVALEYDVEAIRKSLVKHDPALIARIMANKGAAPATPPAMKPVAKPVSPVVAAKPPTVITRPAPRVVPPSAQPSTASRGPATK